VTIQLVTPDKIDVVGSHGFAVVVCEHGRLRVPTATEALEP
jgi:hypothetical protein